MTEILPPYWKERKTGGEPVALNILAIGSLVVGLGWVLYLYDAYGKQEPKATSSEAIIKQYDANKDGRLEQSELSQLLDDYQLISKNK